LQAGFSPEHLIFFRRQAMQARGSLFLSFPAFVFNSLHAGGLSSSVCDFFSCSLTLAGIRGEESALLGAWFPEFVGAH
jgi:hypothetical protein